MVETGIKGGICHAIHRYAKANNNYIKIIIKTLNQSSYLMYLDANNQHGWVMFQKLPGNSFKWVKKCI